MTPPKVLSLSRARKDRARADARREADANAAKHGRTKAERLAEAAREDRGRAFLDARRFEDE